MPAVAIDPGRARAEGSALVAEGDATYDAALRIGAAIDELQLGWTAAVASLLVERITVGLWRAGVVLHLVSDAAERGDALDGSGIERIGDLAERLVRSSPGSTRWPWLPPAVGPAGPISAIGGDLGRTYRREARAPFTIFGRGDVARGRALVARALADTGDPRQIRADEFELVRVDDERYVVVLPGVTDLSRPDLGLSDTHRSVRDLDQHALDSARSTSIDDNRYAEMVMEGLVRAGVPEGSHLFLVGHSFGGDTAVDLAADERFNGGAYRVTHVVAAGYHFPDDRLVGIPSSTEVLVLQNDRDLAVIAERAGHRSVGAAVEASEWVADHNGARDPRPAADAAWGVVDGIGAALAGAAGTVRSFVDDHASGLIDLATAAGGDTWQQVAAEAVEHVRLEPRLERLDGHVIVDVFEGGRDGLGHHPSNYLAHVTATDAGPIGEFLGSVAAGGYARTGTAVAIDVSVPDDR